MKKKLVLFLTFFPQGSPEEIMDVISEGKNNRAVAVTSNHCYKLITDRRPATMT